VNWLFMSDAERSLLIMRRHWGQSCGRNHSICDCRLLGLIGEKGASQLRSSTSPTADALSARDQFGPSLRRLHRANPTSLSRGGTLPRDRRGKPQAPRGPRGVLCLLAQGSRPVNCFVSGGIKQKNGGVEQARRVGRDNIPCPTTETTNGHQA